ncbi:DUF7373 family lipoprotein [Tsukamurella pseudospumae]|nr:hypothetical protein [Tsukamurella pseudospumae]
MGRFGPTLIAAALVVSACSTTIAGTAVSDPSAAPHLDTGGFPTKPRDVPARVGSDVRVQPSFELGNYLIVPAELDAGFTEDTSVPIPSLPSTVGLALTVGKTQGLLLADEERNRYIGGAVMTSQRTWTSAGEDPPRMTTYLMRYRTSAAVDDVVAKLKALPKTVSEPKGLPGKPDSFEAPTITSYTGSPVWYIPRGDYLLGIAFKGISRVEAESIAGRWVDRQIPKLAEQQLTADQLLAMPADRDGILSLTIPGVQVVDGIAYELGYMSPRTWAQLTTGRWSENIAIMDRAGIDLIGSSATKVFRARDNASAEYYRSADRSDVEGETAPTSAAAPAGVPGAQCKTGTTKANGAARAYYACTVVVGRYYATTSAISSLDAAQQQISAQYLILQHAK